MVFEKSQMDLKHRIFISVYRKGIQERERYLIVNVQVFERLCGQSDVKTRTLQHVYKF